MNIPKSHPRYESLMKRERVIEYFNKGIVATAGLIAQGRGEAFDYLIGEKSMDFSVESERAAVALMKSAKNPIISVNGNATALSAEDLAELSKILNARIEISLFYRTDERVRKIADEFRKFGIEVLGQNPDAIIPGIEHMRALCSREGIYSADVVLIPLEDGDRAMALKDMGKKVISVDLNPLSRTSQVAYISIVDELTRAVKNMIVFANKMKENEIEGILNSYDNKKTLSDVLKHIKNRMEDLSK
ncbi:MAG: 4-phosphopantoate--beta-alanine ligase [Thermoplasmata archaeon]